ncbi:NUDIX domain-containing protein [Nocardia xishanensis]|uniref:NUDIX domain-containing protein n=1 Tax=Nocardia xishanensis TaxID=238964 RepID=UPI000A01AE11|nr:NUDIX domain-containing protein [Nocardia xishanensis]
MAEQRRRAYALLIRAGRVLLLHRVSNTAEPDIWEIPGGAVAPDETSAQTVRREVSVETGLDVLVADELTHFVDDDVHTITFGCFENEIRPELELQRRGDFEWMTYAEATRVPLPWYVRETLVHADALGLLT